MAGPSRFGAIIIVTVLSCAALSAVWGIVIYLLPWGDAPPESVSFSSVLQAPPQSPPFTQVPASPASVKEDQPAVHSLPSARIPSEPPRVPFGMEVRCEMEIEALCPDEESDRRACLQRKAGQLPAPCQPALRERLARMKESRQQMRTACEPDRKQFCRDVPLGGGAMLQCLESHAQEVSDQCFQFLPKRGRLLN